MLLTARTAWDHRLQTRGLCTLHKIEKKHSHLEFCLHSGPPEKKIDDPETQVSHVARARRNAKGSANLKPQLQSYICFIYVQIFNAQCSLQAPRHTHKRPVYMIDIVSSEMVT